MGQAQKCGGVKLVNGILTLSSDNWIFYENSDIKKIQINLHRFTHKDHTITKRNDNINMESDSTITGSVYDLR